MNGGTVSYTINIGANISKVKEAMKEVSQLLNSSNLDKGITSSYERKLGKLSNALLELESKASQPIKTDAELRDVERSIKKVTNLTSELGLSFKELQGKDLSKVFGDFTKPVQNLKDYIKEFDKLEKKYNEAESRRNSDRLAYQADRTSKQREIELKKLERQAVVDKEPSRQKGLDDQINKLNAERKALENTRDSLNRDIASPRGTINKFSKNDLLKNLVEADQALLKFKNDYKDLLDKNGILTKSKVKKEDRQNYDFEALRNQYKQLQVNRQAALENAKPVLKVAQDDDVEKELNKYKTAVEDYKKISEQLNNVREQIAEKKKKTSDLEKDKDYDPTKTIDKEIADLEAAEGKLKKSLDAIDRSTKEGKEKLQKSFNELKGSFKDITKDESFDKLEYSEDNFKKLYEAAKNFSSGQFAEAAKQLQGLGISLEDLNDSAGDLKGKVGPVFDEMSRAKEMSDDFEHLTWRLKYFFSLAGGFNLMRRAIRSAVTTTKELDAAMTQTAVVSTYTVSDMWKTLPKYSKEASKLGTAIKDVYNAQTLYVQQGLDMNTAMDLGVETMKMARVAGIGAEEATNSMTAALRGFNMAIDEKSAQRINDVYSKLAQNTASNTQEISTAMTKTAALANSANMSFENTAAFLATIIESTREGAETAGTALKTVIARFTEVKSLYTKNQLTGTDEEGQEIDVNKISKALRTAGINMNEFFTGAKGLDEIFKELGSKWNNLSTVQQRYIATQAAGSRQQSRFLALMQNYERTVELTEMAYNSAGSGQEQFEKTLDSLAAKTEQLKNSWDTLLMGLANSDAIKGIVDFGTDILNVINKIIDALSGSSGLTKALATLSIGMGVFRAGRGAFGKGGLFSYLLGGKEISTRVSKTLVGGIVTSLKTAKTTPELGAALGSTISNSLKRNFQLWGQGPNVGGQYLPKDQLEQLKADAKEYQTEINKINDQIKEREGYQEKIRNNSKINEEERERALKFNQKEIDNLNKQKQQTADEFAKKEEEKGFSNSTIRTAMTDPEQIQKATVNYKALGNAALIAGAGLAAIASLMRNTGKASQEAVASVEALSTGFTTMAMTMKLLQSVGSAVGGLSFLTSGWGLAIGAAVGAIVGIVKVVDALTENAEERQKRINESITENQTHIKDLENGYKQVDDSLGSIIEKQDSLNKLTEGTLAWKDAVKELNTEIQTLVQNFPEFLEAVEIGDNGEWTIDTKAVERIQQEKKNKINEKKQLDAALQYNNLLEKINKIQENSPYYNGLQTDAIWTGLSNYNYLDPLLRSGNYSKVSQESINGIINHFLENAAPSSYEDLIKDYEWLKYFISEKEFEHLPVGSFNDFLSGLSYYKQLSGVKQEQQTALNSFVTQFLMDQLDEILPTELYGGTFRKFIYDKAKEKARTFRRDKLNSEDLEFYRTKYNNILEAEGTGKKPTDSEIETYAAIIKLTDEITTEYLEYFKENKNSFTQGRLTLGEYKNKLDNSVQGDIEYQISKYYVDLFDSFNRLQEELGSDLNFDDTITASTVSQVESIIRDAKNNYGKEAAIEVASFIKNVYDNLSSEGSAKEEDFNKIVSDIESGVIITQEQLARVVGKSFDGDFEAIRRYFTKPKTINNLIESFSDELSFIDSIRKGQQTYTEEERNKLLQAGYKESDFVKTGQGFSIEKLNPTDVAEVYQKSLLNEITEFSNAITAALGIKESFNIIREAFPSKEYLSNDMKKFFLQDFDNLYEEQIKGILDYFGIDELYNFNTNELVNIEQIDKDALISTYLPPLFESNASELKGQQAVLDRIFETLSSEENQLTSDTYSKLLSYTQEIRQQRGNERANSLLSQLLSWNNEDIFKDVEEVNKFPEFLDIIGKLDWSNINNIEDFQKALKDQGLALSNASGELEELFNTFKQIYKLAKVITADEIKQLTQYGLQLKNEIKNKTDAAYTKEQRDYLVNAQKELADQFVYNAETGGYTYTGNKKVLEQIAQQAAVTTGYEQLQAQKILASQDGSDAYRAALKTIFGVESTEDLSDEQFETIEQFVEQEPYISQQLEAATEARKYAGLNNDQVRMAGASTEQQKATTLQDAQNAGLDINDLTEYAQQLNETYKIEQAMAYAIAYDNMLMNQGIQQLASSYDAWEKVLNAAQEDEKIRGTQEYTDTITGLRETLQKITGTTTKFSEEFLTATDTLKLFKEAAKGDVNAINSLRKSAAKDIINIDSLGAAGQQLNNWIDNLDLDNIQIGAELDTNVADVFQGLLDAGVMTADQVSQALETIGYEPNVEYQTMSLGAAKAAHQTAYISSPQGGMTKVESDMQLSDDTQVQVPIIGGSKAGKAAGIKAPTYKGGAGSTINPSSRKGGGGGGGGGKEFKNDFDKYYNQVEDINELIRIRNLLESDYNQLLKAEGSSGADIYENLKKQLGLLEERRKLTADLADKRKQQLFETMQDEEYKDVAKYAKWNNEDLTIEIDWEAINKVKDSEEGNLIKEYVKKLEDFQSKYDEQIQALEEIEDAVQEIKERGKEEYTSLEDRVRDALIKQIQDKIDELQDVNDSINDTNQKLFDSISETLELQRQERSNAKTEEELTDKEKRLAYLQQDSSNANQVEIAKLQKELADERESYTDTLIDQKISELQRQNDEAQEQRAQQIELMQHSLDWQEKNGEFWNQVYALINEGIGPDGSLVNNSSLATILKKSENWDGLSAEGKMQWLADLQKDVKSAVSYLAITRQLEDIGTKEGTKITFTNGNEQVLTGTVDKNGNVVVKNDDGSTTTYKNVFQDYSGAYQTFETNGEYKAAQKPITTTTKPAATSENGSKGNNKVPDGKGWHTNETQHWHEYTDGSKYDEGNHDFMTISTTMARGEQCKVCGYLKNWSDIGHQGTYTGDPADDNRSERTSAENTRSFTPIKPAETDTHESEWESLKGEDVSGFSSDLPVEDWEDIGYYIKKKGHFATGGLADFTGPAWLDGTRSNPELVLNSRDTQNFIELKDTLADMRKNGSLSLAGGDSYYEIIVNVDQMSSDYDVDKAIDRIKARLAQDGAYRNVNTLSRLR